MIIRSLNIAHFGKFKDTSFSFDEGINIITGENESGKTTIAAFIRGMLYGIPVSSEIYERYLPYDEDGVFGGTMKVSDKDDIFRIERDFRKGSLKILKERSDEEEIVTDPKALLSTLTKGISEEEYLSTGFLSQDAYRLDDMRFKKTEEKTAKKASEDEIKQRFEESGKHLLSKKKQLEEMLDDALDTETVNAEKAYQDNEDRIAELSRLIKNGTEIRDEEASKLKQDVESAEKINESRENEYLREVSLRTKELEDALKAQEDARKVMSFNGLIPLITGIVIGLASGLYAYLKAFTWQTLKADGLSMALLFGGGLLFLILSVIGVIQLIRKKKTDDILRASITEVEDRERRKMDADKAYKEYLIHKNETDEKAENVEGRQAHIDELSAEIGFYQKEREDREHKTAEYSSALSELWVKKSAQDDIRRDIDALNLAMDALKAAREMSDSREELSSKATSYLSKLNEGAQEQIRVEPEEMVHVVRKGRDIDVSNLSTAAAQEVLLSVRLSRLDEKDPEQDMPVVLDDVFANFDNDRLYAGMKLLKSIDRQVILLTCQNREREAL